MITKYTILLVVLAALGLVGYGVIATYFSGDYMFVDGKPVPYRNDMQKNGTYPLP